MLRDPASSDWVLFMTGVGFLLLGVYSLLRPWREVKWTRYNRYNRFLNRREKTKRSSATSANWRGEYKKTRGNTR